MRLRRLGGGLAMIVGMLTVALAVRTALADSSAACDSNQEVVPLPAIPGGGEPDPDNPDHWKPNGGSPLAPAGLTCATVSCAVPCAHDKLVQTFSAANPPRRETSWWCDCADTDGGVIGAQTEGRNGACKIVVQYIEERIWSEELQDWVWTQTGTKLMCSDNECGDGGGGQQCTFHVTTVGEQKIADCNCR